MGKRLTYAQVVETAISMGVVPSSANVEGRDAICWERDGLSVQVWIAKDRNGHLDVDVNIGDANLSPLLDKYGGIEVRVRRRSISAIQWPAGSSLGLNSFLGAAIGEAAEVVVDRIDMCRLLAEPSEVERGRFYIWQEPASFSARLVKALLVARDMKNNVLQQEILRKIDLLKGVSVSAGFDGDMFSLAKHWAKLYSREMKEDVVF